MESLSLEEECAKACGDWMEDGESCGCTEMGEYVACFSPRMVVS